MSLDSTPLHSIALHCPVPSNNHTFEFLYLFLCSLYMDGVLLAFNGSFSQTPIVRWTNREASRQARKQMDEQWTDTSSKSTHKAKHSTVVLRIWQWLVTHALIQVHADQPDVHLLMYPLVHMDCWYINACPPACLHISTSPLAHLLHMGFSYIVVDCCTKWNIGFKSVHSSPSLSPPTGSVSCLFQLLPVFTNFLCAAVRPKTIKVAAQNL